MTYQELVQTDDISETLPDKVNGNFRKRSFLNVAGKTADFTVWTDDAAGDPKDVYVCDSTAGAITVTLPDCTTGDASNGRTVTIVKEGSSNNVVIDADGSQTIGGATTVTLSTQYDFRTIVSDGTEWYVIGSN